MPCQPSCRCVKNTMIRFFRQRGAVIDSIVGVITLGSGESIDSEVLAAALLEPTGEVA